MLSRFLPSMTDELFKIAANLSQKADAFLTSEKKDWSQFEKDLKSSKFQQAVKKSDAADEKLKKYVENFGQHLRSRDVVAGVPSSTKPRKDYTIKRMADGRLSCGCKDWQYKKSVAGGDCKHIAAFKRSGLAKGLEKKSNINFVIKGALLKRRVDKNLDSYRKGKATQALLDRAHG